MATKTKRTVAADEPVVTLRAVEPIRHDGEDYMPGDTVSASETAAAALVATGAAMAEPAAAADPK
jgi:hypothetical protein